MTGSVIAPLTALPEGKVTEAGAGLTENVVELPVAGGDCVLCGVGIGPGGVIDVPPPPPPPPHAARTRRLAIAREPRPTRYFMIDVTLHYK